MKDIKGLAAIVTGGASGLGAATSEMLAAAGAKVTLFAEGKPHTAFLRSGSSYLSAHDNRLLFGLGKTATVERLIIRWPNGTEQTISSPETDRYISIKEP